MTDKNTEIATANQIVVDNDETKNSLRIAINNSLQKAKEPAKDVAKDILGDIVDHYVDKFWDWVESKLSA